MRNIISYLLLLTGLSLTSLDVLGDVSPSSGTTDVTSDKKISVAPLPPMTPYTAEYKVNYGSIGLGQARYQLPAPQGKYHTFKFDSDLHLLVLSDKRHVRSEFTREGDSLVPMRYMHDRQGTGSDYREQAAFAKGQNTVHSRYKDEKIKLPYDTALFDPLMAQLQVRIDLAKGKQQLKYNMVKENEIEEYEFKILGEEKVILPSGSYDTIKLEVVRESTKRQTLFWMAPSLSYLPVRLSHFEKGSKQLDIQLLSYEFFPLEQQLAQTK